MSINTNEGMMLLEREEKNHNDCVSITLLGFYHYLAEITSRKMGINSVSTAHEI